MSYKEDVAKISKLLGPYKLGVICDPWMTSSLMADIPEYIKFMDPNKPEDIDNCKALFIHSQWPDEGVWVGEMQPSIGSKLGKLLWFAKDRGHMGVKPVIYWHLEGSEGSYKLFKHLMDVADLCAFITNADYDRSIHRKKALLQIGASTKIFNKPHKAFSKSDGVIFAGRWYADNAERCSLLESAKKVCDERKIKLSITGWGDKSIWPKQFHENLFPKVPFEGLATLYGQYRIGLNTNLWPGAVSMRYPCMAMAGLPVLGRDPESNLYELYSNQEMWYAASNSYRNIANANHRLTEKIATLLELALEE